MIRRLLQLLQRPLSRDAVREPALIEDRCQPLCRGDFIGTELSFEADEFGLHVKPSASVESRFRAAQGAA